MSGDATELTQLGTVRDSLANISQAIGNFIEDPTVAVAWGPPQCVRREDQGSVPAAQVVYESISAECRRLRDSGHAGLAGALESLRYSMNRLMVEGW